MWFLGSLLGFFCIAFLTTLTGWCVLQAIYGYQKNLWSPEQQAASAIVGTGTIMLVMGYFSYLGVSARYAGPFLLGICILLILCTFIKTRSYYLQKESSRFSRDYRSFIIITSIIAALLVLSTLYFCNTYNPYNDTISYLCVVDYLYEHPFSQQANPNAYFPIFAQALLHQAMNIRMGANFFFSFVLSISPVQRSYELYPALVAWMMTLNVLATYLSCRWLIRVSRFFAGIGALLVAVSINPFHYASTWGFFPQLAGTAFLIFALALLARWIRTHDSDYKTKKLTLILSLSFAFLISAYSELFPFLAIIVAIVCITQMIRSKKYFKYYLKLSAILIVLSLVFANIEIYRMFRAILPLLNIVVGYDVKFSLFQFIGMSVGVQTQIGFDLMPYTLFAFITIIFIVFFIIGFIKQIKKVTCFSLVWFVSVAVFFVFLLYYAIFAINPWTLMHGHTWASFKIIGWLYPLIVTGIVAGMAATVLDKKINMFIILSFSIIFIPAQINIIKANGISSQELTFSKYPFAAYEQLSELAEQIGLNQPIELGLDMPEFHRQMLAYFLYPHPVIADWRNNAQIAPWLEEKNRHITLSTTHLILSNRKNHALNRDVLILPAGVIGSFGKVDLSDELYFNVIYPINDLIPFIKMIGFSTPEKTSGLWTVNSSSLITLFVPKEQLLQCPTGVINFEVFPFLYSSINAQNISVRWGKQNHFSDSIAKDQWIHLTYTLRDWEDDLENKALKKITIQFYLPDAAIPSKISTSKDPRLLGLRFMKFSLTR